MKAATGAGQALRKRAGGQPSGLAPSGQAVGQPSGQAGVPAHVLNGSGGSSQPGQGPAR
jgi:hypothetical protein